MSRQQISLASTDLIQRSTRNDVRLDPSLLLVHPDVGDEFINIDFFWHAMKVLFYFKNTPTGFVMVSYGGIHWFNIIHLKCLHQIFKHPFSMLIYAFKLWWQKTSFLYMYNSWWKNSIWKIISFLWILIKGKEDFEENIRRKDNKENSKLRWKKM